MNPINLSFMEEWEVEGHLSKKYIIKIYLSHEGDRAMKEAAPVR